LALPERIQGIGLEDELAVLGSFVSGPASLEHFAGDAPTNTDDHPVVTYHAPHATYAPSSSPAQRLLALLHELGSEPGELLSDSADPADARRLSAYWLARTHFIESGRDVRPSARVQDMLSQVRGPLVSVLRESPDFRPAYDPLLTMAVALAQSDADGARALLVELTRLQPARSEAERALAMLTSAATTRH
jgi:spermidine synthase